MHDDAITIISPKDEDHDGGNGESSRTMYERNQTITA